MRAKEKCPSCFQPVLPADFLCANCELILDASQATERPIGEISVVRRMLEAPQPGLPSSKPNLGPTGDSASEGLTRKLDLGSELSGVPVVVATLTGKTQQLSEFEAWVVSLIDGLSDANGLAQATGMHALELRVVLRTLQNKHVIDFADAPLSDADLDLPAILGALNDDDDEATETGQGGPAPRAQVRDSRFVAPSSPQVVTPRFPPLPARAPVERKGDIVLPAHALPPPPPPITPPERVPPPPPVAASPAPVAAIAAAKTNPQPSALPAPERTDPRIVYSGSVNRKVLDALKKVKRVALPQAAPPAPVAAASSAPLPSSTQPSAGSPVHLAEVGARDMLQVALRMEQSGRLDEAIRYLKKSIAQSPNAASLYNRLGIILMRERADYRRAEALIRMATELAPDNVVYSTNLQQVISRQAIRAHR